MDIPQPETAHPRPASAARRASRVCLDFRGRGRGPAFTLVELLVVISLIALLIAILLPALGNARASAQLAQTLSNLRQIGIGSANYAADFDGSHPITPAGRAFGNNVSTVGWCSWSFGGKFADPYWATRSAGIFDFAPDARPINPYVYRDNLHDPVTGMIGYTGHERPAHDGERQETLELDVFRSPRDIATMQRTWPNPIPDASSYDDVGTSYHANMKWLLQLDAAGYGYNDAFALGHRRFQSTAGLDPARFVLYHDQVADTILSPWSNGLPVVNADFGRPNQSAMTYLDGHANLTEIQPGQREGDDYTFVIELD